MKILNTFIGVSIAVCLFCSQISCKKETDNYDLFPIKLTSVDTLGTTKLSWTKIETSDFIEYVIVRSSRDTIGSFSDLSSSRTAQIIGRLSTAKQNEFFDTFNGSLNVNRVYYRVFARLKNRTISSANYVYNSELSVVATPVPSEIIQDDISPNLVYLNAANSGIIALYDLEKDSILARISSGFNTSRTVLATDKSNSNNSEIIHISIGSSKIVFRDAKTLDIKFTQNSVGYSVYNVTALQNGFICIFTDEYNKQFKIMRLSDHAIVSTQSGTIDNYSFYSYSISMDKTPNSNSILIYESGSSSPNFGKLTYDAQGNFTSAKLIGRLSNNNSSSNGQFNRISAQGNYYFLLGQMYAAPLDITKPLNVFIPSDYSDVIFKQDESKYYVVKRGFTTSNTVNVMEEYSLPNGKLLRTLTSKILGRTVLHKDKAYVFGSDFNSSSLQTILQKIQL
jgi:hypothetical protein